MNAADITFWGLGCFAVVSLVGGYFLHRAIAKPDEKPVAAGREPQKVADGGQP